MKAPSYTLFTVLAVDLLATSGDITATWTSPMYPKLYSNDSSINPIGRPITSREDSWIGSIINLGSVIGALPAGYLADKFGRKKTLLALAIPHIAAYITYAFATNIYWFLAARFWSGLSYGAGYALLPMYIAEITKDSNRGAMSVTLGVFWSFGNFLPFGIGPYLSIKVFNLILAAIPTTFFIIFCLLAPETPQHLVYQGKYDEAKNSLSLLRSSSSREEIQKELELIKVNKQENGSLKDIWNDKALRYGLFVAVLFIIFNQLSGINAIGYYLQNIFEDAKSNLSPDIASSICGAWAFIASFVIIFFVEKMGRRVPLIISSLGCALSLLCLGLFFFVRKNGDISKITWLPIASVLTYNFFFNFGLSSIPWTVSSELFPNSVKPITAAVVSAIAWVSSFLVTQFFYILNDTITEAGTFWVFAGFCLAGAICCYVFMPETKGKSFPEIYCLLQQKTS